MFATHAAVNVPVAHGEIAGSQSDSMVDAITGSEVTFGAMAGNRHACAASESCANTSNARPARFRIERRPLGGPKIMRSNKGSNNNPCQKLLRILTRFTQRCKPIPLAGADADPKRELRVAL